MDLLVIGAGQVGRALARAWSAAGHTVTVAVRDPGDPKHDGYRAEHTLTGTAALPAADATTLAVPGTQLPTLLDASGAQLDGRLVIDATNTAGGARMHQLPLLSARLPGADVYRAFTCTGWENFTHDVAGERPDLPYCGPDRAARTTVEQLIADTGPRPGMARRGNGRGRPPRRGGPALVRPRPRARPRPASGVPGADRPSGAVSGFVRGFGHRMSAGPRLTVVRRGTWR